MGVLSVILNLVGCGSAQQSAKPDAKDKPENKPEVAQNQPEDKYEPTENYCLETIVAGQTRCE